MPKILSFRLFQDFMLFNTPLFTKQMCVIQSIQVPFHYHFSNFFTILLKYFHMKCNFLLKGTK